MKFYLEEPSLKRKEEALEYLEEHRKYASPINGVGGMDACLSGLSYEEWLTKIEKMKDILYAKSIKRCPGVVFFLIRKDDDRIVGMISIRHHLSDVMKKFGGHIGYGIRPTERRKGYNKINLYLGLIKAYEDFGLDKVIVSSSIDNFGSDKTIKALGGVLERSEIDPEDGELTNVYLIDVWDSINKFKNEYLEFIDDDLKK